MCAHLDTNSVQCYHAVEMLTTKKQGHLALVFVASASLLLTACGPPGLRALHKGDRMIKSGNYDAAIEALQTATNLLSKEPTNVLATACNLLGLAYHHSGSNAATVASARQLYYMALSLDRNLAAADYNLGCLELEQNNLTGAKNAFITYTSLRPRDGEGQMKLGTVCFRLAQRTPASAEKDRQANFDLARKAFANAGTIEVTPEGPNNIAVIDLTRRPKPSPQTVTNALAQLKTALLRDPRYPPALLNLAILYDPGGPYKIGGDITNAINAYKDYLAVNPPNAQEIALLITNLDRAMRFTMERPSHPSEYAPPSLPPASSGLIIQPAKTTNTPTGPRGIMTTRSNAPPGAVLSAPVSPALATAPVARVVPPAPVPKPEETLPVHVDTNPVTSIPTNTAPDAENSTASEHVATPPVNTSSNVPLESTIVRKPSVLARLFGAKPKPTESATDPGTTAAGTPGSVTPLPAPQTIVHYLPPPVSTDPGNRAEADRHVKEGAAAAKESRWRDAMAAYDQAVKSDPSDYDACEALGIAAIKAEDYGLALESLHHALVLNPDSANARYDYAWTLEKKRYFPDAAAELEKLLENHPDEVRAHLLVGTLYSQQLGQPDLARGHYKKVLELQPQNLEAAKIRLWLQNNPGP